MNKALLTIVCAASISSYAMAATPIDLTAQLTTGSTVETLQMFNLKFMKGDKAWVSMNEGSVTIDQSKRLVVKGGDINVEAKDQLVNFGSVVNFRLPQMIRRPGQYEIIVPEGLVSYNGECNKEITTTVTITGSSASMSQNEFMQYFTIDPADGSSLSSLGAFTLVSSTKLEQALYIDATLKAPDGQVYQSGADFLADDTQAQYRFNAPATAKGAYVLTIPEGTLRTTLPGLGTITNPELKFNYTVKDTQSSAFAVEVDIEASPLNATLSADSFSSFFINVTDGDDALGPFIINSELVKDVVVQTKGAAFYPSAVVNVENDPKAIELRFATPVTAGGEYTVILPEGLLGWENFKNARLTLENAFTCTGEVIDYFSALNWFSGNSWDNKITIGDDYELLSMTSLFGTFGNIPSGMSLTIPTEGEGDDELGTSRAKVELPDGEVFTRIISPVSYDNHSFKIAVSFETSGYRQEGEYKITIPAGSFLVNGNRNPEIVQVFHVVDNRNYTPVDLNLKSSPNPGIPLNDLRYISWTVRLIDEENKDLYSIIGLKPNSTITVTPKDGKPFELPALNENNSYDAGFAIDFKPDITANGEYVVSIPEGIYRLRRLSDDQLICNRAETYTYIVRNDGPVTPTVSPAITPAPGSSVASLSRFDLYRPTGYKMYLPEPVKNFTLTLPSGDVMDVEPTTNANVVGEYIFVYLPETLTTPGEYKLTIPDGGIEIFDANDNPVGFPGASYDYTVTEYTPTDLEYTVDPVDGSTIYWLGYTYVKFEEKVKYTTGVKASVTNPAGQTEEVTTSFNAQNNRLMLTYGYNSDYGKYTFTVPQGIVVTEDGRTNKEFTLSYEHIKRQVEKIAFTVDPKEGLVAELDRVTLTIPEEYNRIERSDYENTKLELTVDEQKEPTKLFVKQDDDRSVYVQLNTPVTVSGTERKDVTLTIPEGVFILHGEDGSQVVNATARLSWRVDKAGVAEIFGNDGLLNVFTLDGKCLLRGAEADALQTLDKGTYIINGKTVIIR